MGNMVACYLMTVSLAFEAIAASSSSLMSTALRKLVASPVLNCGGLP